jgi:hypothetical protein
MLQLLRVTTLLVVGIVFFVLSSVIVADAQESSEAIIVEESKNHPGAYIFKCPHGNFGVADDEKVIVPPYYSQIVDCPFGYARTRNGFWELTDAQGVYLPHSFSLQDFIPTPYGSYIGKVGYEEFVLINKDGKRVPLPSLRSIEVLEFGYLIRTAHYHQYVLAPDYKKLFPYMFDHVEKKGDFYLATAKNDDVCVFNTSGKLIIPLVERIDFFDNNSLMVTSNAVYNKDGAVIPPGKYYRVSVLQKNKFIQATINDGSYDGLSGIYSLDGRELVPSEFWRVAYLKQQEVFLVVKRAHDEDMYGLYDSNGNCILEPTYANSTELKGVGYQFTKKDEIVFFTGDSKAKRIYRYRRF